MSTFEYRKRHSEIERVDRKGNKRAFIKKQIVDKAKREIDKNDKYKEATTPEANATNEVVKVSKKASYKAHRASKQTIKATTRKLRNKRLEKGNKAFNNENNEVIKGYQSKIRSFNHTSTSYSSSSPMNKGMKQYVSNKLRITRDTVAQSFIIKTKDAAIKTVDFVKRTIISSSSKYFIAGGICLIVVFSMFFGAISSLAADSSIIPAVMMVSDEVLAYEDTITKYAKEYGIEDYVSVIEAIMMQESGGKGNDPMQSSACPYNNKYPDGITDPEYSIKVGIHYFADCLSSANTKDTNDTAGLSLALQGYNYGNGYISWAIKNFNGYTKANAKVFSDMKKSELGVSTYGDPEYVDHVLRYVSFGFGSIRSEPNFNNTEAWVTKNPYARAGLYGQCTWFAWGRFYEIYGYSPGFTGDGWKCVDQLVAAHPDKFKKSSTPVAGAVFSTLGHNHVGIVIAFDGTNITFQDGNLNGKTDTFAVAKTDWRTKTMTLSEFISHNGGVVFAVPIH